MAVNNKDQKIEPKKKGVIFRLAVLLLSSIIAILALIIPKLLDQSAFQMQVGDVTSQEILAPYSLTYDSEILTDKAQQEASANVNPIYLPADPSIGRHQVESLRSVLYYISTVRQDKYASNEQKLNDLKNINNLSLSDEVATRILNLNEDRWKTIQDETTLVLEQVMRNTIRSTNLASVKSNVPSLIDYAFPEEQAKIIIDIISAFIIPNSLYSEDQTLAAREQAAAAVDPISRTFVSGETLVRRGQILKAEDWEALDKFGLIQFGNRYQEIGAAAILVLVLSLLLGIYFTRVKFVQLKQAKSLALIAIAFLLFLIIGRFFIVGRTLVPYVYPIAALSLTLAIVFNYEISIIITLVLGILMAYDTPRGFELAIFYIVPSILGILTIGKARRISSFFASGITISLAGISIVFAFRFGDTFTDWIGIASLSAASVINGLASASLTLFLQYVFAQFLDITTPMQLLDLSRTDHPLLQRILRESPGSYQHSLQVANLAEHAAESIGADTLLVRVGAIYHDCGKSLNPQFFIENQVNNNINSHDDIDPVIAADTIIHHITDGVTLAKKYRLPSQVIDFIKEHHGTLKTQYQYTQALQEAEDPSEIDETKFQYPGPSPRSRETAILMLADGTEARARAEKPADEAELSALINKVINYYKNEGQLDHTDLTLRDITTISESFLKTLRGIYHPRIQYPSEKSREKSSKTAKLVE